MTNERWLLPSGMDEMLPEQAITRERLRREIFDLHRRWGYLPVHPPFVEYLESLLTAAGQDSDRQTFRVADPVSGRMLGVRADMTPQVARIDAHQLATDQVSRLFYMGTVIRALGERQGGHRSPLQLGAELYGHRGSDSDVEIIRLMLATLAVAGIDEPYLDLGHVGVFRSFCSRLKLESHDENELFEILQRKAETDLHQAAIGMGISADHAGKLKTLCSLHGGVEVLQNAEQVLEAQQHPEIAAALQELRAVGEAIASTVGAARLHFDLAELRGYQYHNGVVFAAYVEGSGSEIARGGRYDDVGAAFGRARAATGYSTDLKALMRLSRYAASRSSRDGILAPVDSSQTLQQKVAELRAAGETVIADLERQSTHDQCNRILVNKAGDWTVETLQSVK
jgi:ATP phosphoribosyltransferase regulatory subunit